MDGVEILCTVFLFVITLGTVIGLCLDNKEYAQLKEAEKAETATAISKVGHLAGPPTLKFFPLPKEKQNGKG